MTTKDDGGPAFPTLGDEFITDAQGRTGPKANWGMDGSPGMSLRDWFAGQALSGLLASPNKTTTNTVAFAKAAYNMADAMIAEGKK